MLATTLPLALVHNLQEFFKSDTAIARHISFDNNLVNVSLEKDQDHSQKQ